MGTDRLDRNYQFLIFIADPPTVKQRQAVIKIATQDQVLAVSEIILNTLSGNIPLSPQSVKDLTPYKKDLRRAGSKKNTNWKSRRSLLVKMGKAVSLLVSTALEK